MITFVSARMKKIQSKIKALEWAQHTSLSFRHSMAANSEVSGGIRLKFELIQAFMHFLVTCKNEDDAIKMSHNILPILSLWRFFQTLSGS